MTEQVTGARSRPRAARGRRRAALPWRQDGPLSAATPSSAASTRKIRRTDFCRSPGRCGSIASRRPGHARRQRRRRAPRSRSSYDPLLAKLIALGRDARRGDARASRRCADSDPRRADQRPVLLRTFSSTTTFRPAPSHGLPRRAPAESLAGRAAARRRSLPRRLARAARDPAHAARHDATAGAATVVDAGRMGPLMPSMRLSAARSVGEARRVTVDGRRRGRPRRPVFDGRPTTGIEATRVRGDRAATTWVFLRRTVYVFWLGDRLRRARRRRARQRRARSPRRCRRPSSESTCSRATRVKRGDILIVLEAMKMELPVRARRATAPSPPSTAARAIWCSRARR